MLNTLTASADNPLPQELAFSENTFPLEDLEEDTDKFREEGKIGTVCPPLYSEGSSVFNILCPRGVINTRESCAVGRDLYALTTAADQLPNTVLVLAAEYEIASQETVDELFFCLTSTLRFRMLERMAVDRQEANSARGILVANFQKLDKIDS